MEVIAAIERHSDETLKEHFRIALACARRTLDLFSAGGVAFSFNGGKDSTVLLHILRAAAASQGLLAEGTTGLGGICTFIFERDDDFPDILGFVRDVNRKYNLGVEELEGDFKSGLEGLLSRKPIKAVVIGTRRGDPNAAGQDIFCPSSDDWPAFMRVNPILEWGFADVWAFLKATGVEYCSLYDRGYTSIGSIHDTFPNSSLQKEDGSFAPAYMLADGRMERAGRNARKLPKAKMSGFTKTAAVIIIGDEILSGKVEDSNSRFLCRELFDLGWRVNKIVTVPDEVGAIRDEVHSASESHDLVLTTGGVGPTPDDVTMAGVARALGYPLTRDTTLEGRLREYFGEGVTEAHLKMAETPAGEVEFVEVAMESGEPSPFPIVHIRNTFILPGIPALLQQKWKVLKEELRKAEHLPDFHSVQLRLAVSDETEVTPVLNELASEVGSLVSVGSYPIMRPSRTWLHGVLANDIVSGQRDGAKLVLSLESKNLECLNLAKGELLQRLLHCVVSEGRSSADLGGETTPSEPQDGLSSPETVFKRPPS